MVASGSESYGSYTKRKVGAKKVLPRSLERGSDNQQHRALALNSEVLRVSVVHRVLYSKNTFREKRERLMAEAISYREMNPRPEGRGKKGGVWRYV